MEIKSVCLIGGGLMGRQIALNSAIYGYPATVYDVSAEVCDAVEKWADEYLAGRLAKGKMTEDQVAKAKAAFKVEPDFNKAVSGVDCVIEAIVEVEDIKHKLFKQISDAVDENVIIATNSSYMVSSIFKDDVKNPSRLANMHYYNPALVMKFVEIVQGPHTSTETAQALKTYCDNTGKKAIWMKKEIPGFAANYIIRGIYDKAFYLVEHGYCSYQDVDLACEFGLNHPMGPFRLNDLTGVDLTWDMKKAQYEETGVKSDCHDMYEQMVKEGRLGRKTGKGFYEYE